MTWLISKAVVERSILKKTWVLQYTKKNWISLDHYFSIESLCTGPP